MTTYCTQIHAAKPHVNRNLTMNFLKKRQFGWKTLGLNIPWAFSSRIIAALGNHAILIRSRMYFGLTAGSNCIEKTQHEPKKHELYSVWVFVCVWEKNEYFKTYNVWKRKVKSSESKVFQLTHCSGAWFFCCIIFPPGSLTARPWKMVVGKLLSYWDDNFSGATVCPSGGYWTSSIDLIYFSATWKAPRVSFPDFCGGHLALVFFVGGYNERITRAFLAFLWKPVECLSGMSHRVSLVPMNDTITKGTID